MTFEANRPDSVQIWTLINFDKFSITPKQLNKLINYAEDADWEIGIRNRKKELYLSTYFDHCEYRILSDEIITITRPYNVSELNDIILNLQQQFSKDKEEIYKYANFIQNLKGFLENEKNKKERIQQEVKELNVGSTLKAGAKLDLINQLMNLITSFEEG